MMQSDIVLMVLTMMALCSSCLGVRSDRVATLAMDNPGPYGVWGDEDYCAEGQYAYGFGLQIEPYQGPKLDDTGLNGVALLCRFLNGTEGLYMPRPKGTWWGTWQNHICARKDAFITGVRMKTYPALTYKGDGSSVDNLAFTCSPSGWEVMGQDVKGGKCLWGKWGTRQTCPEGSSICGLKMKVEFPPEVNGARFDDTSVNDVRFFCCQM